MIVWPEWRVTPPRLGFRVGHAYVCPQSTVHTGRAAREARESPRPSTENSLTTFRLTFRRVLATAILATLTLGVGGLATTPRTAAVAALPEPVAYTGVEYDGTGDVAERLQRAQIAADAAVKAHLAIAVKKTKPKTAQTNDGGGGGSVPAPPASSGPTPTGRAGTVVAYGKAQVGKRYVFGATGPNTFDCSGLVVAAYKKIGISLPHYTGDLLKRGRSVSRSQLVPGDLVFPSSGHVGIYIGGGQIVHASNPKTSVKISSIYAFYAARRIL